MSIVRDLRQWDTASQSEQERAARHIAEAVVQRFTFQRLETFAQGNQQHSIAIFDWHDIGFALLPGYDGDLGIEAIGVLNRIRTQLIRNLAAREAETKLAEWSVYLTRVLTPVRRIRLQPCLVQRVPTPLEALQSRPEGGFVALPSPSYDEVLASVISDGFDLLTSDEWEYACSGGARTLFRWGDTWPDARRAVIHRTVSLQHSVNKWIEDKKVNAFGLSIAQDPYHLEYCQEPGVVRGGDGGTADSSDAEPYMAQWLPLATAYRYPFKERMISRLRYPYLRRTVRLPYDISE